MRPRFVSNSEAAGERHKEGGEMGVVKGGVVERGVVVTFSGLTDLAARRCEH